MDFTYSKYKKLLETFIDNKYDFQTYREFIYSSSQKVVILRHDVDKKPLSSLNFARIQSEYNIRGSYYFRAVKESWDKDVILEIASLGHEIGYHYECLTTCKGNIQDAINDFEYNLNQLRELSPVETICMHGSPMSKFDSKNLWIDHSYRNYGIIGEPYFDVNFNEVFYLTDTGRMWDGYKYSVRDKIASHQKKWIEDNLVFHSTSEIIESLQENRFPLKVMLAMHPQRWTDNGLYWLNEFIAQSIKNIIKKNLYVNEK